MLHSPVSTTDTSALGFSSVVQQNRFSDVPVIVLFSNQLHVNRQHCCLSVAGVIHSELSPGCLSGARAGLALGDTAVTEAGKATAFSGSRSKARVFRVQRVGERKQRALWEQPCLGGCLWGWVGSHRSLCLKEVVHGKAYVV